MGFGIRSLGFVILFTFALLMDSYNNTPTLHSCPGADHIPKTRIDEKPSKNSGIAPALTRAVVHDCFVERFDASSLLDSVEGSKSAPNFASLRGDDIVDEIKRRLEAALPERVLQALSSSRTSYDGAPFRDTEPMPLSL